MTLAFDDIDLHILSALQANARMSNADLARELEMAPSAILERIRKLEQRGAITGYEARISPKAVGLGLTAYVHIRVRERMGAPTAVSELAAIPEVLELHHVAGEDCLMMKLRARDTDDLARLLRERVTSLQAVVGTRTTIVLSTVKESATVSLQQLAEEARHDA